MRHLRLAFRLPASVGGLVLALSVALGGSHDIDRALAAGPILQLGPKLQAQREIGPGQCGFSAALSAEGRTALIGGHYDDAGGDSFGGKGAAWVFTRSGSTWVQAVKLTGGGESGLAKFGWGLALSRDGKTALVGGYKDDSSRGVTWTGKGAAWTFVIPLPAVDAVNPSPGPTTGGTRVRLIGNGFAGATAVWFGTQRGQKFVVESPSNRLREEGGLRAHATVNG